MTFFFSFICFYASLGCSLKTEFPNVPSDRESPSKASFQVSEEITYEGKGYRLQATKSGSSKIF